MQISIIIEKARLYQSLKRTNLTLKEQSRERKLTADKLRLAQGKLERANLQLAELASKDGLTVRAVAIVDVPTIEIIDGMVSMG